MSSPPDDLRAGFFVDKLGSHLHSSQLDGRETIAGFVPKLQEWPHSIFFQVYPIFVAISGSLLHVHSNPSGLNRALIKTLVSKTALIMILELS